MTSKTTRSRLPSYVPSFTRGKTVLVDFTYQQELAVSRLIGTFFPCVHQVSSKSCQNNHRLAIGWTFSRILIFQLKPSEKNCNFQLPLWLLWATWPGFLQQAPPTESGGGQRCVHSMGHLTQDRRPIPTCSSIATPNCRVGVPVFSGLFFVIAESIRILVNRCTVNGPPGLVVNDRKSVTTMWILIWSHNGNREFLGSCTGSIRQEFSFRCAWLTWLSTAPRFCAENCWKTGEPPTEDDDHMYLIGFKMFKHSFIFQPVYDIKVWEAYFSCLLWNHQAVT